MSQPDLFVVCKNCGSEVSPYVTECPYCGQRVRKRAPKLERDDPESEPRAKQRRKPRIPTLPKLRAGEIEGIAPDTRPIATLALIVASLAVTIAVAGGLGFEQVGGLVPGIYEEPWRYVTTAFVHDSTGYQFAALLTVGIFGTLLERRFGWFAPLWVFLVSGAAGAAAAEAVGSNPLGDGNVVFGANGAGLGMLTAWLVNDRLAARRGDERGNDLIGVAVIALVLLLMPLAATEADPVAGVVGALAGGLLGLLLTVATRRG